MKSDIEPAILALKEAAWRESDIETVMEEALLGDRQANGAVENAVKNAHGQFRVAQDALEIKLDRRLDGEHPAVPRVVMQA